jgi:hypothetical protein
MERALFDTLTAAGLMGYAVRTSIRRYGIMSTPEFIEKGAVALAHMEDDHEQGLKFQRSGEPPRLDFVTLSELQKLQQLLAERTSRLMDRALFDTLAAARLVEHGLVEYAVANALTRHGITSIPEFIEKGEVALAHLADDRAQGHKVHARDSTVVTLIQLRKLQQLLAELKARSSPHAPPSPHAHRAHASTREDVSLRGLLQQLRLGGRGSLGQSVAAGHSTR